MDKMVDIDDHFIQVSLIVLCFGYRIARDYMQLRAGVKPEQKRKGKK